MDLNPYESPSYVPPTGPQTSTNWLASKYPICFLIWVASITFLLILHVFIRPEDALNLPLMIGWILSIGGVIAVPALLIAELIEAVNRRQQG